MNIAQLWRNIKRFLSKLRNNTGEEEYRRMEEGLKALKKEEAKPFNLDLYKYHEHERPLPDPKFFKPRKAYEKRMWNNQKKLPKNFKDEDEE